MKQQRAERLDDPTRKAAWDELIRLMIRGASQKKASEMLGFHINTIKGWQKKPEFKLKLARTKKLIFERSADVVEEAATKALVQVEQLIDQYSTDAISTIHSKMTKSSNEHIQLKAAIDLADRGPRTSKTKKIQASHLHAVLTPEILAAASRVAKELNEDHAIGKHVAPIDLDPEMAESVEPVLDGE